MSQLPQNLIVLTAALLAAGYLLRRGWKMLAQQKSGGCGGCGNCPSTSPATRTATLQLSADATPAKQNNPLHVISGAGSVGAVRPDV